jgi:hypothetical protein
MSEDLKQRIEDWFKKQKGSKYYIKDVAKAFKDVSKPDVKKAVKEMIDEGRLDYWSSGSTTYITLPGVAAAAEKPKEE